MKGCKKFLVTGTMQCDDDDGNDEGEPKAALKKKTVCQKQKIITNTMSNDRVMKMILN